MLSSQYVSYYWDIGWRSVAPRPIRVRASWVPAPALLQDNVLKTACDLVIVMVCALELAYTSAGGKDGASAGRYTVFFAVAMVGVLASCAFALVVKICRLMVHTGSTSCVPHAARVLNTTRGLGVPLLNDKTSL